jgi:hypothetical protein
MPKTSKPSRAIVDESTPSSKAETEVQQLAARRSPLLIMVYGKHCFHCHEFKPTWDQTADLIENRTALRTLTMEASAMNNDYDTSSRSSSLMDDLSREVRGVPYVALRHGDGTLEPYNGERSVQSIVTFVSDALRERSRSNAPKAAKTKSLKKKKSGKK